MIISHDHPDVFVPSHALHLAIGKTQTERPGDGSPPQVMRGERLFAFIEAGEACPAVDDLADVPRRKRLVEFESAEVHQWLEDEGIVAVAVKVSPAHGVQLQVVVNSLPDILGEG